ncbi:N-methyl-L-tryptophan oxidase [Cecembia lonarensis]|uniref:Monomeric sarcosine oxidase n=1 Tax=Cecembia lonarensis (strain CCUG 58316 / KCTC 22772 / LW9) TaxID=1225176 RepID=K1LF93_CECL9|nr:N-methyl-L-tryptophan oxidase [Cecembia lonarensis]EKB50857.1 Monomeric sarcosine oxidase [Cecembia lonarensis LW9]
MNRNAFDIAVIGLGAIGASTLWHFSKSSIKVLGIDQFSPPHTMGSSHGETRITRLAVGEGMDFVPIVMRSHEIWKEIEMISGKEIMTSTGGLLFDSGGKSWSKHGSEGFFKRTVHFAQEAGIPHEVFDAKALRKKHPEFNLEESGMVYYEPSAGFLRPELAINTQLQLAEQNGAIIKTHTKVLGIAPLPSGGVLIKTNQGEFEAGRAVISAGAWVKDFLPPQEKSHFKICRQILHWLPVKDDGFKLGKTPVYMWGFGPGAEDFIYGFPSLDGKMVKMASESFVERNHPDTLSREVTEEEQMAFIEEKIAGRFNLLDKQVLQSKVCIYTVTPDSYFVIDELPDFPEVLIASACSGHGFKHSAGLGEGIADHILGKNTKIDLKAFSWKRNQGAI